MTFSPFNLWLLAGSYLGTVVFLTLVAAKNNKKYILGFGVCLALTLLAVYRLIQTIP